MYNRVFTWVKTRAKSELRVRLVLSSFSFYWRRFFVDCLSKCKKPWPLPRTAVCVLVGVVVVVVGGGGGQDVITIKTSTMTPLSATVSRVSTGVGGWGIGYKCI